MLGKTVLITGATGGIGEATARSLAKQGAHIILVGRDIARGTAIRDSIRTASRQPHVTFLAADLASLSSVRDLARRVLDEHDHLDVLVNNAGGLFGERQLTSEGLERMLVLNHLSPLLLTERLLPALTRGDKGRVVFVSASAHRQVQFDLDNLDAHRWDNPLSVYARAKLAGLIGAFELARRLERHNVSVNVADPGMADTRMTQGMDARFFPPLLRPFFPFIRRLQRQTPLEAAAASSVYLASSPNVARQHGLYVLPNLKAVKAARRAYNLDLAQDVWTISHRLLGESVDVLTQPSHLTEHLHAH